MSSAALARESEVARPQARRGEVGEAIMYDPHNALKDWYAHLPETLKGEVAAAVGFNLPDLPQRHPGPGLNQLLLAGEIRQVFEARLEGRDATPRELVTRVLVLRTLVSFFVARNRNRGLMKAAVERELASMRAAESAAGSSPVVIRMDEREDMESRRWRDSLNHWDALCETSLSDDSIESWSLELRYGRLAS